MDRQSICGAVEAILYVAGEPVEEDAVCTALGITPLELTGALDEMAEGYAREHRGVRLLRFGRSVQLSTNPEYSEWVERMLQPVQRQNLSQAAMETLAVIAYRQPATRGDVEAVRGVKCDYSVQSLLAKGLIEEAGKRDTLGRPTEFRTTDAFLRHFGIASLDELPAADLTLPPEAGEPDGTAEEAADADASPEGENAAGN